MKTARYWKWIIESAPSGDAPMTSALAGDLDDLLRAAWDCYGMMANLYHCGGDIDSDMLEECERLLREYGPVGTDETGANELEDVPAERR